MTRTTTDDDQPVQCWHTEADSPCDWNICRQPERLTAGDYGTDPATATAETAWTMSHQLHVYCQVESKPDAVTGWWTHQATGLVHLLCNCGYSTGWIPQDQMPSRQQIVAEHGAPNREIPAATPTDAERIAVAQWLAENGIDPHDVALAQPVVIEPETIDGERSIRYTGLLRNEAGSKYVDFSTGHAATEERTARLTVEPPTNVQVRSI